MWGRWELGLWTTVPHCLSPSRQTPRPTGGNAEDSAGLFWVLDEEVRVDGSSDTVVLERLRVAFEKTGVGVEGKGVEMLSPAWDLATVFAKKGPDKACRAGRCRSQRCLGMPVCDFFHSLLIHHFLGGEEASQPCHAQGAQDGGSCGSLQVSITHMMAQGPQGLCTWCWGSIRRVPDPYGTISLAYSSSFNATRVLYCPWTLGGTVSGSCPRYN